MPDYRYEKKVKVAFPECDSRNQIKLSDLLRQISNMGSEHLEALGLPYEKLWGEGFVYLLTRMGIRLTRRPSAQENISVATVPREPKGVQFTRDVYFYGGDGEEIIYVQTAWVLANPETHKIYRPREFPHPIPREPGYIADNTLISERLKRPENAELLGVRTVRYSDIDCNLHMNNAIYADVISDFLPEKLNFEGDLAECHIAFVGEVKLGEDMKIFGARREDGAYYIGADRPQGDRCFDAVLKYKE